jgi:hypothetical protein
MKTFTRSGLGILVVALVACSGAGGGAATPSAARGAQAPDVAGGHEIFQKLDIHPMAGAPPILINFVANGPSQGGVPCISCVNGASSADNIGMTGPSSYVPSGATWQYALSFTDISYKGKCKLAWVITGGKKTIDSFSATLNIPNSAAGGFILYALNRGRPSYSGAATLTGKVTCGKSTPSLQVPLEFQ